MNDTPWLEGYKLDSGSTKWRTPCPPGVKPGDIAFFDSGLGVSPLATAYVTHDSDEFPSEILLRVFNWEWIEKYNLKFSAPSSVTGCPITQCGYPSVEVTYLRGNPSSGILEIEVVWQQLAGPLGDDWNLYYRKFWFPVSSGGVNWLSALPSPVISFGPQVNTFRDEVHPDLCIVHDLSTFLLVFNRTDTPPWENGSIWAVDGYLDAMFPPQVWDPYIISDFGTEFTQPKSSPKVEAVYRLESGGPVVQADAVWTERHEVSDNQFVWDVYFVEWDALNPGITTIPITNISNSGLARQNACPNLAQVLPGGMGSGTKPHNAVVAWTYATLADGHFIEPKIHVVVSPDLNNKYVIDDADSLMPDVAPYPTNPFLNEGWFGLGYYRLDTGTGHWRAYARSYSFTVDSGSVSISPENSTDLYTSDAIWTEDHPFTGATMCLRVPVPMDLDDTEFGYGWFDQDPLLPPFTAWNAKVRIP